MAELTTIARPYAEAAFALARERNALPVWSQMLQLASAVVADPRVADALDNPKLDAAAKESLLLSICGDKLNAGGPQLRARADRGATASRCCRQIAGDVRDAEGRRPTAWPRRRSRRRSRFEGSELAELTAALEARFGKRIEADGRR